MKSLIASLLMAGFALSAVAVDKAELEGRIAKLTVKLDTLQAQPGKRVPAEKLRQAQGVVLMDRTKAGFIFAYQGGGGVAMARDPKTGQWSAPAFVKASEPSLGFQVGGQQSFVVMVLMTTNAIQALAQGISNFGGEASGTAGDASGGVDGAFSASGPPVLVYSDRSGFYGGAALKDDSVSPDAEADVAYYGSALTFKDILLEHKGQPGPAAAELARKLEQFAK